MGRVVRHFAEFGMAKVARWPKLWPLGPLEPLGPLGRGLCGRGIAPHVMPCLGSWMAQEHSPQVSGQR